MAAPRNHPRASLDSPRGKLARAYEHLEALDREAVAWFDTKSYEIIGEFDAQASEYVFRIHIEADPPDRLGLIVGDFAQNLRAALDHLVWQLTIFNGKRPNRSVRFPIYRTAAEVAGDVEKRIGKLRADHRAAIERLQPHHAGDRAEDHGLCILAWLSNTDKHKVIHPTFGFLMPPPWPGLGFAFNDDAGSQLGALERTRIANGRRITEGAELARVRLSPTGPNPQVQMHGSPVFEIAFGDRWLRSTRLEVLYKLVERFVERFAPDLSP